jgi:hypothetical protein
LGEIQPEGSLAGSNDDARRRYAVRLGDRRGGSEPIAERLMLTVEVCVQRQLPRDDERRHEHDARAPVGGQSAGEIECVLGLGAAEQRHADAPRPPHQRS